MASSPTIWRCWWEQSRTGQVSRRVRTMFQRAVPSSRTLLWIRQIRREAGAQRRMLGVLLFGACAATALTMTLMQPELRTVKALGVRAAVLLGVMLAVRPWLNRQP